jgi:hypothetical protein
MVAKLRQFVPNSRQRIDAIKHVVYEYGNLLSAGHCSISGDAPWRTHCDDAFLLGCRKLDDFLMKTTRSKQRSQRGVQELDDVLAVDYLSPKSPRNWDLPLWAAEWRVPMNKQLAHIAYFRDKEWDHRIWVPKLEQEFRKAWSDFRSSIIDDDYNREFDKRLDACRCKTGFGILGL